MLSYSASAAVSMRFFWSFFFRDRLASTAGRLEIIRKERGKFIGLGYTLERTDHARLGLKLNAIVSVMRLPMIKLSIDNVVRNSVWKCFANEVRRLIIKIFSNKAHLYNSHTSKPFCHAAAPQSTSHSPTIFRYASRATPYAWRASSRSDGRMARSFCDQGQQARSKTGSVCPHGMIRPSIGDRPVQGEGSG
jgi:hypothetical protein